MATVCERLSDLFAFPMVFHCSKARRLSHFFEEDDHLPFSRSDLPYARVISKEYTYRFSLDPSYPHMHKLLTDCFAPKYQRALTALLQALRDRKRQAAYDELIRLPTVIKHYFFHAIWKSFGEPEQLEFGAVTLLGSPLLLDTTLVEELRSYLRYRRPPQAHGLQLPSLVRKVLPAKQPRDFREAVLKQARSISTRFIQKPTLGKRPITEEMCFAFWRLPAYEQLQRAHELCLLVETTALRVTSFFTSFSMEKGNWLLLDPIQPAPPETLREQFTRMAEQTRVALPNCALICRRFAQKIALHEAATPATHTLLRTFHPRVFNRLPHYLRAHFTALYYNYFPSDRDLDPKKLFYLQDEDGNNPLKQMHRLLATYMVALEYQTHLQQSAPSSKGTLQMIDKQITQLENTLLDPKIAEQSAVFFGPKMLAIPKTPLSNRMHIVSTAFECAHIVRCGGLAEVVYGLSTGLIEAGHTVTLILPKFEGLPSTLPMQRSERITYIRNGKAVPADIFQSSYRGIELAFLDAGCFRTETPYAEGIAERSLVYTSIAAQYLARRRFDLHIGHDAHTMPLLHMLSATQRKELPSLYVIHNNYAQGTYDPQLLREFHLRLPSNNALQDTLPRIDAVVGVSRSNAIEMTQSTLGAHVDMAMRRAWKEGRLFYVQNAINLTDWDPRENSILKHWIDPETLQAIDLSFDPRKREAIEQKKQIKTQLEKWLSIHRPALYRDLQLEGVRHKPILFYVGRYATDQKGLDMFPALHRAALDNNALFIATGTHEDAPARAIFDRIERDAQRSGGAWIVRGDESQAIQCAVGPLLRAVSLYVMPSSWEPCGLVAFEAFANGCPIVATSTGGLRDSVSADRGYSFPRLDDFHSEEQADIVYRATCDALRAEQRLSEEDTFHRAQAMAEYVEANNWTRRTQDYSCIIEELRSRKTPRAHYSLG